jgi:type I restriction enzyme S subunit
MREMKDSGIEWIGEIPAEWTLQRGKTIFAQRLTKGNHSEILLAATQKYGMLPQSEIEGVVQVKEDADLQQFRTVHKKDFVISLRSFQGGFEYSQYEGVCSPAYQVFYNTTPICHNYYRLLFKSDGFIQKMNSMTVGIREGKNIQYSDFANSLIPVPPIDQQQRIADYLDRKCSQIDAIIARQKEVIEKLKAYKLSVITEAVTSTDSQMCRFRNCITTIEQGWSPAPAEIVGEDGWFVLSLSAVKNGKFIKLSKKPIDANENIPTQLSIKVGDLLMTRSNTRELVGDVCLVDSDCPKTIFSDLIYRISLNDALLPCYAIFLLQSAFIRQQIQESARGSSGTMPKISHKSIKNLNIHLPSIPEQREISDFLRNKCNYIDTCIQEKERLIKKLTSYKKSLIYEVVTGKKEV